MKVSVCMIAWNEEDLLPQAVASTKGLADEVVVVDTGSEDDTVQVAKDLGCKVITGVDRFHKAEARNTAIDMSMGDWVVILDADEIIADPVGLNAFLEAADVQAVYIKLAFMDANDQPTLSYQQMRCWKRDAFRYKYRAHEVPVPTKDWGRVVHTDFVWEHRPPPGRTWKLDYTLNRLQMDVEENPSDARPLYYLGRQYRYCERWDDAIETLKKYLDMPGRDEADAWHDLALSYAGKGDVKQQIKALYQACASQPERREWWCGLAALYHEQGKDDEAVGLLKCALELPPPGNTYHNHYWYGQAIHDLLARCLWRLGRYEEGRRYAQRAVELEPDNQRLRDNLNWFDSKINEPVLSEPTRIFITGCAKSGTTLLRRLFYAFEDVEIIPDEVHITQFVNYSSSAKFLVGKRHRYSPYSEHLSHDSFVEQTELIKQHDVKVINIVRDGRDVVFSDHRNVSPRRWVAAMDQQRDAPIDVKVKYEDVVTEPDWIQGWVSRELGLVIKHKWSDYPDFVPETEKGAGNYRLRPLDTSSVGKDLPYKDLMLDTLTSFDQELCRAGYEVDEEAVEMDAFYQKHGPDIHTGRKRHQAIADLVRGPRVLDVGCGTGDLLLELQDRDSLELFGTDISAVALAMARERGVKANLLCRDVLPAGSFDTVVLSQVLEHLDDDEDMLCNAVDHLEPGGLLLVSVPEDGRIPSPEHRREYTENSLRDLLGAFGEPERHECDDYRILMSVTYEPTRS